MKITTDQYNGITIDSLTLPNTVDQFREEISLLLERITDKKLLWVKIPIEKSEFIPILTNLGFTFHHCNEQDIMLVKKLVSNPIIPTSKHFAVGVGAIIRDNNKILVVKDKFSIGYKLPGGHIDHNEKITDALKREVFEETGVQCEFESIANLGHFTKSQFGEAVLYIVCTAKACSKEISIHDSEEIVDAIWMDIDLFLSSHETNGYNKAIVKSAIENRELKLTKQDIPLKIPGELFF